MKPYEKAEHIAKVLNSHPQYWRSVIQGCIEDATRVFKEHASKNGGKSVPSDLSNPEIGIPYALSIGAGAYPKNIKDAAILLRMCLHAIERGEINNNDKVFIPMCLAAISGFIPEQNSRNAKHRRQPKNPDWIIDALVKAHKMNPGESLKELLTRLEGDGLITEYDRINESFEFFDESKDKFIRRKETTAYGWLSKRGIKLNS